MERKIVPWVILFGLIMIAIGHYKRMSKEEAKHAAGYDPLIESIVKHNVKEDKDSGIGGFFSKNKKKISKTLGINHDNPDSADDGEAIPEDGFLRRKDGKDENDGKLRYRAIVKADVEARRQAALKKREEPEMESVLSNIKDPVPVQNTYYPPAAPAAAGAAPAADQQPKTYYPPAATGKAAQ